MFRAIFFSSRMASKRPHPASLTEHMKRQRIDPNNRVSIELGLVF